MDSLKRFIADVSSWYWWVTVIFVGLLVNLASSYMKSPLDRWIERRSIKAAQKRRLAETEFQNEVDLMVDSHGVLAITGFMELRHRLMSIVFATFSVLFIRAAKYPTPKLLEMGPWAVWLQGAFFAVAFVSLAFALWAHRQAGRETSQISAARRALVLRTHPQVGPSEA